MKNKNIFIILLIMVNHFCIAQNSPSIQTDRPDQTECPFITPKHFLQFENGFTFERPTHKKEKQASITVLTRFGVTPNFELRLSTEYISQQTDHTSSAGVNPIIIGFKTKIIEENGIIPRTAFIGHLSIPQLATPAFKQKHYTPDFRFTMQHTVSDQQTLSYNLGTEWEAETLEATFIYTLATGYALTKKTAAYLEFYGFIPQTTKPDHRFDGGLTYLVNPNHQLDLSVGLGLSKASPNYFISIGYSLRFQVCN